MADLSLRRAMSGLWVAGVRAVCFCRAIAELLCGASFTDDGEGRPIGGVGFPASLGDD